MGLKEFKKDLTSEVQAITSSKVKQEILKTSFVPSIDDPDITYPNLETATQKSKLLTTAVLFVDLRKSTAMSMKHDHTTLAPIYSAYVRAMSRCGQYFGGHVRNIIGDRVMVVFDKDKCFHNSIQTAILMNSVVKYILNEEVKEVDIRAGIGIDYGSMLVTKTGIVKQGKENSPNKSLVWLGKPANVASKLTDMANKQSKPNELRVSELHKYGEDFTSSDYIWVTKTPEQFLDALTSNDDNHLVHKQDTFRDFLKDSNYPGVNPPILMTKFYYDTLVKIYPDESFIKKGWFTEQDISVPGYSNKIYGGDVWKSALKE